ncbi:hypothetical protein K438DRAFT_502461 [Mycena galopus ATCC 62051]|nr:hypothetical protein K438DRAFT_502461 [Mycena galopus ATCC 62051]
MQTERVLQTELHGSYRIDVAVAVAVAVGPTSAWLCHDTRTELKGGSCVSHADHVLDTARRIGPVRYRVGTPGLTARLLETSSITDFSPPAASAALPRACAAVLTRRDTRRSRRQMRLRLKPAFPIDMPQLPTSFVPASSSLICLYLVARPSPSASYSSASLSPHESLPTVASSSAPPRSMQPYLVRPCLRLSSQPRFSCLVLS